MSKKIDEIHTASRTNENILSQKLDSLQSRLEVTKNLEKSLPPKDPLNAFTLPTLSPESPEYANQSHAEILVIADSNGGGLKPDQLHPTKKVEVITRYTIEDAMKKTLNMYVLKM